MPEGFKDRKRCLYTWREVGFSDCKSHSLWSVWFSIVYISGKTDWISTQLKQVHYTPVPAALLAAHRFPPVHQLATLNATQRNIMVMYFKTLYHMATLTKTNRVWVRATSLFSRSHGKTATMKVSLTLAWNCWLQRALFNDSELYTNVIDCLGDLRKLKPLTIANFLGVAISVVKYMLLLMTRLQTLKMHLKLGHIALSSVDFYRMLIKFILRT